MCKVGSEKGLWSVWPGYTMHPMVISIYELRKWLGDFENRSNHLIRGSAFWRFSTVANTFSEWS